jgi:RNA polymerase sigma-70 factor (ECF subfamily)
MVDLRVRPIMPRRQESTEHAAVERLFREEYGRLVVVLTAQLRDRGMAEECVQDSFVELVRRWDKVATYADPKGWLWLVALRRARRLRGRLTRRAETRAPEAPALEIEALMDLQDAIRQLPTRQREVVVLHYFADLSMAVIAASLGISLGTVKSQLHDARNALRGGQGDI